MSELPEISLSGQEVEVVNETVTAYGSLSALEIAALIRTNEFVPIREHLRGVRERVFEQWGKRDYVVVRNVPTCKEGTTGLLLAAVCFGLLKPYRGRQIVKHFRMSPWTTALSHTLASGFFHTDINTSSVPPAATIMQCLERDPGAPAFGQLRVARVADLLCELKFRSRLDALRFLTTDRVEMVNETSPDGWKGIMVEGETVRFHPESLQAAQKKNGTNPSDLAVCLQGIHEAALAVSSPIDLAPGEILFVSNRRAMHQRGACTVRFREYPRYFDARRVSVLHALAEPS
jgi:hypothetical protein